jgi:hypothetical protein
MGGFGGFISAGRFASIELSQERFSDIDIHQLPELA